MFVSGEAVARRTRASPRTFGRSSSSSSPSAARFFFFAGLLLTQRVGFGGGSSPASIAVRHASAHTAFAESTRCLRAFLRRGWRDLSWWECH